MKILPKDKALIDELRRKQDQNALFLGIVEAEYDAKLAECLRQGWDSVRRGSLLVEREDHREFLLAKIRSTREEQRVAGEAALCAIGVDTAKAEYQIHEAEVLQLVAGHWVPYETAQAFGMRAE